MRNIPDSCMRLSFGTYVECACVNASVSSPLSSCQDSSLLLSLPSLSNSSSGVSLSFLINYQWLAFWENARGCKIAFIYLCALDVKLCVANVQCYTWHVQARQPVCPVHYSPRCNPYLAAMCHGAWIYVMPHAGAMINASLGFLPAGITFILCKNTKYGEKHRIINVKTCRATRVAMPYMETISFQSEMVPVCDEKTAPTLCRHRWSATYGRAYPRSSICCNASSALPSSLNSKI